MTARAPLAPAPAPAPRPAALAAESQARGGSPEIGEEAAQGRRLEDRVGYEGNALGDLLLAEGEQRGEHVLCAAIAGRWRRSFGFIASSKEPGARPGG